MIKIINIRREREQKSLENLKIKIPEINTMEKFHSWFFTEHKAYCADQRHRSNEIDEGIKKSY